MPNPDFMKRIVYIDVAKAICMVLVVVGHYLPDNSPAWYVALNGIIYTFHMPLFMFASGYVYSAVEKGVPYAAFLRKKVMRLMVPYLSVSVILITAKLLAQCGGLAADHHYGLLSYFRMFYLPEAGYYLWFIWVLWWMFALVHLFTSERARLILFLVSIVMYCLPVNFPAVFCLYELKNMMVFFMLGVVSFECKWLHGFVCKYSLGRSLASIFLFIVAQAVCIVSESALSRAMSQILPCIGVVFVLDVSKLLCNYWRIGQGGKLMAIAASSYVIYLFHSIFESLAGALCARTPLDSGQWYVFVPEAVFVVSCGIVVPMLLFRLLKKYRVTRLLFGL